MEVSVSKQTNPSIPAFSQDVIERKGYIYSTNAQLSSQIANQRLTQVGLEMIDYHGKKVIDIGCGDGVYTIELYDMGKPKSIVGIDPAEEPIKIARERVGDQDIEFSVHTAEQLPFENNSFDIAYVRGVLHHMDNPADAICEALRVARHVVVIEPNGYNLGLKVIERLSPYHRQHGEKSYPPHRLDRWVQQNGGRIIKSKYAGFVPMFCPDWLARIMKWLEPVVEALPLINNIGCAVFVFLAEKN
jgi:ubiquinone/menaquinone biosynthesis C-methylase UbiE